MAAPRRGLELTVEGVKGPWFLCPSTVVWAGGSSETKSEPSPLSDRAVPTVLGEGESQGTPQVSPIQSRLYSPEARSDGGVFWQTVGVGS